MLSFERPLVIHLALNYYGRRRHMCRLRPDPGSCMLDGRTQMNQATPARESVLVVGERDGLQLVIKRASNRNLGKIISRPNLLDSFSSSFVYPKPRESVRSQWREIYAV
jgi:hypothetical protein